MGLNPFEGACPLSLQTVKQTNTQHFYLQHGQKWFGWELKYEIQAVNAFC
jgi:hypothetical protein